MTYEDKASCGSSPPCSTERQINERNAFWKSDMTCTLQNERYALKDRETRGMHFENAIWHALLKSDVTCTFKKRPICLKRVSCSHLKAHVHVTRVSSKKIHVYERDLEKRRIYMQKRPMFVRKVSQSHLKAHTHIIRVKRNIHVWTRPGKET